MGKSKKPSFADKLKANLAKAGDEAAKVAKKGLEAAKDGAEIVADQATKAAKAGAKAAKDGAQVVAEKAGEAKEFLDEKTRSGLDHAYAAKQKLAQANLERLRKADPNGTPADILVALEADLVKAETKNGDDSEEFASATAMYIFTAVEIYGDQSKDPKGRQRLIDATVMIDSSAAKLAAKAAGVGIAILLARTGTKGALSGLAKKAASATALVTILGIKNPGKKSATWIAVSAVNKFLGQAPEVWAK
jgi:hypothetical protein